jgi:hypothetical protein
MDRTGAACRWRVQLPIELKMNGLPEVLIRLTHRIRDLPIFGAFCIGIAVAGYATVFVFNQFARRRNYHIFAAGSLVLFLLGSFACLPSSWLASFLGIAATVAISFGSSRCRLTLAFHGLIYLFAAWFASGLAQYASHAMAGTFPAQPEAIVWIIATVTVVCYAMGGQIEQAYWQPQIFHTLSAALAVVSAATALASAVVWFTDPIIAADPPHIAVICTLTGCALALALAWLGPRWQRIELVWLAYATVVAVAAKLLFEDLRQGHPEFLAISIFLYAVTLIFVPQVVRRSSRKWKIPPLAE